MKTLPPPFLPPPGEEFDYGLFIADQISELLYYWQLAITLTETPEEILQHIISNKSEGEDKC
jgi:hypothetical protein